MGEDNVYISFSGGKDSTVLMHLAREIYPNIPTVFINTGLEYPEIQMFVRTFDNVQIIYPKMFFGEVIRHYGYPIISKEVSECIYGAKRSGKTANVRLARLNGELKDRDGNRSAYNCEKYKPLLYVDFPISNVCCNAMKKLPAKRIKKYPIIATMAEESRLRTQKWLQQGCNAFDARGPKSKPMSFWTEQDILQYVRTRNIKICSVYGDIVEADKSGQITFEGCGRLCTTGCARTGCIFCAYGAHLEKGETRFQRLKRTHPKQYEYCMGGGGYENGVWLPNKAGLGMAHVFDEMNKIYGKDFIRYE
jgi:3'-phosphoadenosine 5'-phosphosulfate sulfotransferase (PAPS reductase)/FAD synthetase